jgi:transcriptional regulator with XRE-family HTH domain
MKYVGERLKEVMAMRGIKASKMAKDLNLGRGHISNIVTGRIQSPKKHLVSIAAYLNVSQSWLLTGEGNAEDVLYAEIPVYEHFG